MDRQRPERLGGRHDFHPVDVEVRGQGGGPEHRFGDVVGGQRSRVGIDLLRLFRVALEADQREVGLAHARLDIGHPDTRSLKVGAQSQRELFDESLRRAIDVPAGIRVAARRRSDIDDVAASPLDHARQQRAGCEHQPLVVGVDHGFPVVRIGLLRRIGAQCQTGIVDQGFNGGEFRRQAAEGLIDRLAVADVQFDGVNLGLQFVPQGVELFGPASDQDQFRSQGREAAGEGAAEIRRWPR